MTATVVPLVRPTGAPGRHALGLLDAARSWRRCPADQVGGSRFPDATVRRMGAAGLLNALAPLDTLMLVIAAHAEGRLDLGRAGDPPEGPDARLLAWMLEQAVTDGAVSVDAIDRLALRVDIGARPLLEVALRRIAATVRAPVQRGVWPGGGLADHDHDHDHDADVDADAAPMPAFGLAAE